jgi:polyisoprenoid-binding protein YceI
MTLSPLPFLRSTRATLLTVALIAGCANEPADGKPRATATAPSTPGAIEPGSVSWPVSQQDSKVEFVGAKLTGKHNGGFDKISGTVQMTGSSIESALVKIDIDMKSMTADAPKLTGHLKSADFFDVEKFPTAAFISTSIKPAAGVGLYTIVGNLTMKGVAKAVTFPATIKLTGNAIDAKAEFAINRKDWGIVYPGMTDDLIKDDVLLKLTIRSTRPKS